MLRLGPSIVNPNHPQHIFDVDGDSLEFGSAVRYAGFYSDWREENEGMPLVWWTKPRLNDLADIITKWVVHGR